MGYRIFIWIQYNRTKRKPGLPQLSADDGWALEQALLRLSKNRFHHALQSSGTGHKLFASSYFYYSSQLSENERIPILARRDISEPNIRQWMETISRRPSSLCAIYKTLQKLDSPTDIGFASLDLFTNHGCFGSRHRHDLVVEATRLALSELSLNHTGNLKTKWSSCDSYYRPGFPCKRLGIVDIKIRATMPGRK